MVVGRGTKLNVPPSGHAACVVAVVLDYHLNKPSVQTMSKASATCKPEKATKHLFSNYAAGTISHRIEYDSVEHRLMAYSSWR